MVDLATNDLNGDEHSAFQIIENGTEIDFVQSYSATWDLLSRSILKDESVFNNLKGKINSFIKDNPIIVDQIKSYFYDELVEHILKRSFRVQFTINDSTHTNILYNRFFVEQNENIRIIFDYFFNDIRLLILSGQFEGIPWPLRHAIIYIPKSVLLKLTMTWINLKGAETFTTMLYRNLLNQNETPKEEQSSIVSFSFDDTNIWLFIIIYIFILFAINIHIVGTMINCSAGILLIAFILYYSLTRSYRFNR